jgi:hypothetical protein
MLQRHPKAHRSRLAEGGRLISSSRASTALFAAVHESGPGTQETVNPAPGGSAYRDAAEARQGCAGPQLLVESECDAVAVG